MKKLILLCCFFIFSNSALAISENFICPFTDYFYINTASKAVITSLSDDGNILATIKDDVSFTTSCKSNTQTGNGHAYLTVKQGEDNLCTIHILDGPYLMNPEIEFTYCMGNLEYIGIEHPYGSYQYFLKFSGKE